MQPIPAHTFDELRQQFPEFIYHGFQVQKGTHSLKVQYDFELPGFCHFRPEMEFPERAFIHTSLLDNTALDNLLFHIGMIELISYWKATCSPIVRIKPYKLDAPQIEWWKHLYYQGLGEFFYVNNIMADPATFMQIESDAATGVTAVSHQVMNDILVPVGGGKDSVVTLELLKKQGFPIRPLIMNPRGATIATAAVAGFELNDCLVINRSIDPQLLRLNQQGFLNGHTPFSALLAFSCILAGALTGSGSIALSNEASADEATIKGTTINHQYSKSFEFEKDFTEYTSKYISKNIRYFSFLRPLHEIQIAKIFSRFPQYFPVFKSCNVGSKTDTWCGSCAKCLFAYIILSPFIAEEKLVAIFGHDLLNNESLLSYFNELCGISENKPFECIGTINEVNQALKMTLAQRTTLPTLLKYYQNHPQYQSLQNTCTPGLSEGTAEQHFLSKEHFQIIKRAIND